MLQVNFKVADQSVWQNYSDTLATFSNVEWHVIDTVNWPDQFPYKPSVRFQILYTADSLMLHYDVQEDHLRANAVQHNDPVWEDSCVECFISFDTGKTYFNIEFNLLGAGLIGTGSAIRKERKRLDASLVDRVASFTNIKRSAGQKSWQMVLVIPLDLLGQDGTSLSGKSAHANFYKCGDNLPQPHYLTWQPIASASPGFHQPEFFGKIAFV